MVGGLFLSAISVRAFIHLGYTVCWSSNRCPQNYEVLIMTYKGEKKLELLAVAATMLLSILAFSL